MDIISIGIIEDNVSYRKNLIKYLSFEEHFDVKFDYSSVEEGLFEAELVKDIQVLLLDIGLPGMTGIEGIQHLKQINPQLDIIMVTAFEDEQKIVKALCAGASSYLSKKSTLEEIVMSINIVHNGGAYMSPSIARELFNFFDVKKTKKPAFELTSRQQEIINLMIRGKTNKAIAKELFIAIDTVRYHVKLLYQQLHAANKAEAIANYLSRNLN